MITRITSDIEKVDAGSVLDLQATLLSHARFNEGATALATDIAVRLHFDRVSIGLIEHGQIRIAAISHSADVEAKHAANRAIAAAMEEAIEQSATICHPEHANEFPRVILAHAALAHLSGNQISTIPLTSNDRIFGAMTLERGASVPLSKAEIASCEHVACMIGPILLLKWRDDHAWHNPLQANISSLNQQPSTLWQIGVKLGLYAGMALAVILLFIPVQYYINAPARLEGQIQRALVAPDNGYLQEAHVRPGDSVRANQVLAVLADQDLQLEMRKWQSELTQYENAYGAALARSDRVQLVINQAKAEEARSQLTMARQQLERSRIVAPFDGIVIKGDLRQSLGAPVQRGDVLLTIAPATAYRLMIDVDERDVSEIQPNQPGMVALVALPDKTLPFKVQRVTPVAVARDGRNFFEVEATLTSGTELPSLRPGLEGVAKISINQQPFIWIWTHRITDWARLTLWSWGLET